MNSVFYAKLAVTNIKKNAQTYLPYTLTCIGTVMMFYIVYALSVNPTLNKMSGGTQLQTLLNLGTIVVGLFSLIFLFYANSFLIKRRKKEFGLFNILGMEKKHIGQVVFLETLSIAVISLYVGILGGILLSRLMFLLLLKILAFEAQWGFDISFTAIKATLILFAGIFFLTLLNNLRQISLAKPMDLLRGEQIGEREPKTKWLLIVIGVVTLASGYYIALTTESPLSALFLFFIAVILVIIGTYCLFTAGSIGVLKLVRKNKRLYYKPNYFISISGMIYRMKQNAVGLANICILSTMVLVTLSTTVSLYVGMEDVLRTRYPRNIMITSRKVTDAYITDVRDVVSETLAKYDLEPENKLEYRYLSFVSQQAGDTFLTDYNGVTGIGEAIRVLYFIPSEDYSNFSGETVNLDEREVLLYSNQENYEYDTISVLDLTFTVKEQLDSFAGDGSDAMNLTESYYLVVKDMKVLEEIYQVQDRAFDGRGSEHTHYIGFDLSADSDDVIAIHQDLRTALSSEEFLSNIESAEASKRDFYSLYGGLFFLGIFLGTLFILGTMLIIYYKQITEGYDDRQRFEIMQKVGMSQVEVKQSIRSQVLMVFFLPLVTATIHIAVAFKFVSKILAVLNLTNTVLFAWCTVGTILIFALFYAVVYSATAKVYYKIVSR